MSFESPHTPSKVESSSPCGVLVVDKPSGITSHDVVSRIRRLFHTKRVGHTGTLDPLATGVLVLCLGQATRIAEYLTSDSKEYIAGIRFGLTTDSQDITGQVLTTRNSSELTQSEVEEALVLFRGDTTQIPPMVSAIHHEGKRLYELARAGIEVERYARPITFYEIELLNFTQGEYAEAEVRVLCSSGAYIRTLAHDIGRSVGCGATMTSLRRTAAGGFTLDQSVSFVQLANDAANGVERNRLIPIRQALADWPTHTIDSDEEVRIQRGKRISAENCTAKFGHVLLISANATECALAEISEGEIAPFKVFPTVEMSK